MIARLSILGISLLAIMFFSWLTREAFGRLVASNGIGSAIAFGILLLVLLVVDCYIFLFGLVFSLAALLG